MLSSTRNPAPDRPHLGKRTYRNRAIRHPQQNLGFQLRWMGENASVFSIWGYCCLLGHKDVRSQSVAQDRLFKQLRDLYRYQSIKDETRGLVKAFEQMLATSEQAEFFRTRGIQARKILTTSSWSGRPSSRAGRVSRGIITETKLQRLTETNGHKTSCLYEAS